MKFQKGVTMLGLQMALPALQLLETLNKSLQNSSSCASWMLIAVSTVQKELQLLNSDECFQEMFARVTGLIVELDLQEIKMPR